MSHINMNGPFKPGFAASRRRSVTLSSDHLVKTDYLRPDKQFPLVMRPATDGINAGAWAKDHREFVESRLREQGAILLRGFDIDSVNRFDQFVRSLSSEFLDYFDQHTPRSRMTENIYTSTEYPAEYRVPFHSENSKNHIWPMRIWFCCLQPAEQGGETPIADNRKVFESLDEKLKARFMEKQVMYVRNFGHGLGLPWQTAFQTESREEVERLCRRARMQPEWKDGNRLKVRHVCQAVSRHPQTGEVVWFNQAHLFHISGLEPSAREALLENFKVEDLPSNAYYGDGSQIETSVLEDIREAFRQAAVTFPWQQGDVMMLDNMLMAHGRAPFAGSRKVIVAMANPCSADSTSVQV